MFGISGFELFLIILFGFLIFGPEKLPDIAKTIGKAIAKFRNAQEEMNEKLKDVKFVDKDSDTPFKNPIEVIESAEAKAKQQPKAACSAPDIDADKPQQRSESFAERKAKYDKQRAEQRESEKAAKLEEEKRREEEAALEAEERDNPKADIVAKSVEEEGD